MQAMMHMNPCMNSQRDDSTPESIGPECSLSMPFRRYHTTKPIYELEIRCKQVNMNLEYNFHIFIFYIGLVMRS